MEFWELTVDADERAFNVALARLKRHGLTSAIVDHREDARVGFRVFLPSDTAPPRLLGLVEQLVADAVRMELQPTRVKYRRTEHCEAPAFEVTPVGPGLLLVPAGADVPPDGRLHVRLLPRAAFGSVHQTTRLCLEALQARALHAARLADVGCGSGVLGIAALKLGAAAVTAVDVDPVAIAATRDNAVLNGVALQAMCGDLTALGERRFDGVLCNTLAPVLERVIPRLDVMADWALLSGIRDGEQDRIAAACAAGAFTIHRWRLLDGWALAELERSGT